MISTIAPPFRHAVARTPTSLRAATIASSASRRLVRSGETKATTTRRSKSATAAAAIPTTTSFTFRKPNNIAMGLGGGLVLAGLHSATGSADDFYDYRFLSKKDPDDLASFYGGEELMELFCVMPIVSKIMLRNARFDDTGNVTTTGIPGQMRVSMVFSDEANDEGVTDWFNKRERFKDTLFGYTCYDMVINYGERERGK